MADKLRKQAKKRKPHEPELLDHSYLDDGTSKSSPYIYLFFIVFVLLSFVWKGFVRVDPVDEGVQEPRSISQKEVARPKDMLK